MGWFGRGKRSKMSPMFKCVICQRRGADTYHYELPVCSSCKTTLQKRIEVDGGAILKYLEELPSVSASHEVEALSQKVIHHASQLVPYESLRLKTTTPEPTEIIRVIHAKEYQELVVQLWDGG